MRDTHTQRQKHRQWEKQAPLRERDVGLDPRTPGLHPGLKADTQPLGHPSIPLPGLLNAYVPVFNWNGFVYRLPLGGTITRWTHQNFFRSV